MMSAPKNKTVSVRPDEMEVVVQWVEAKVKGFQQSLHTTDVPFSFKYGGKPSAELLGTWNLKRGSRRLDDKRTEHTLIFSDPKTGLVVRNVIVEYHDFPTVEWTIYFKNTGAENTPILENIQALDTCLEYKTDAVDDDGSIRPVMLHHHTGSPARAHDYQPHKTSLYPKPAEWVNKPALMETEKIITTSGGRSSDSDFPYFNLEGSGEGTIVVVGWPGQWAARFTSDSKGRIHVSAGQELTHFILHPGEEVRAPLIVMQFWKGDRIRAQNIWRRWMLAYNLPRPGGKPLAPMSAGFDGLYFPSMLTCAAGEKEYIDRYLEEDLKPDWWWHDAGWYVNNGTWSNTGTWEVDRQRYPEGLRGVNDYAHAKGMQTIVWFEPERVSKDTWLLDNHPEWILSKSPNGVEDIRNGSVKRGLLNLGNPEALHWLINHVDKLLTEEKIDHYRQDFNMPPLEYWRKNDTVDRQGITEIKHITGYLAFWDELRRRHPDLLIDTCAAGGRRNDLETLRRSAPLWRSDYSRDPIGSQCQTYGLSSWVPYYGTGAHEDDLYFLRSAMAPFMNMTWDMKKKHNYPLLRRFMKQWRDIAGNCLGDYYPLTSYSLEDDVWMAWQFDRPDLGEGMVQVFRRSDSPFKTAVFKLQGLDASIVYKIINMDSPDKTIEMTGEQLMKSGLKVAIEQAPQAVILVYMKKK